VRFCKSALACARRAIELDPQLAEAHCALAFVLYRSEWNWEAAELEYQRTIQLNVGYGTGHYWYSVFLAALGRFKQAEGEIRVAREVDPLSLVIHSATGLIAYLGREYERSIECYRRTISLNKTFFPPHREIGMAYIQLRCYDKAIAHLRRALALQPRDNFALGRLGHALALGGNYDKAREALNKLRRRSRVQYVSPDDIALIYAALGDLNRAMSCLERAYEDRAHWLNYAKVDPLFDVLRPLARFRNLLERMGHSARRSNK
jgi:tetratricopeptide (TPR) repeat protein